MTGLNIKDFLTHGSFLQIGPDLFKILIGPFIRHDSIKAALISQSTLLYKPDFWDFLQERSKLSQKSVYSAEKVHLLDREEFILFLATCSSRKPHVEWKSINETQFRTQFEWSQNNFKVHSLDKTVPIIREQGTTDFTAENLVWCLQNLIQSDSFGWSYGFFENNTGVIGHTPEILAQWTNVDLQLNTVALAGTLLKTDTAAHEMLLDKKILNEHQIVIDDITNKLSSLKFSTKCIQGPTDVLELKYLLHLMTEFQIEVGDIEQVFNVIDVLHPTAAMGIYPSYREKLKEFSDFSLQTDRQSFAAPFAIVEKDSVYCVVAIRNMFFNKKQVQIFSGCGVTRGSQYELEISELQNKRDSVKKMLGLLHD